MRMTAMAEPAEPGLAVRMVAEFSGGVGMDGWPRRKILEGFERGSKNWLMEGEGS